MQRERDGITTRNYRITVIDAVYILRPRRKLDLTNTPGRTTGITDTTLILVEFMIHEGM